MPDRPKLEPKIARNLAERLAGIGNFPKREGPAVIDQCAEFLLEWCSGTEEATPEEQARWLISETIRGMRNGWTGYSDMEVIFRGRFDPVPCLKTFEPYEKIPVNCKKCRDGGTVETPEGIHRCACSAGRELSDDYLNLLRSFESKRAAAAKPAPRAPDPDDEQRKRKIRIELERLGKKERVWEHDI
jgi:hypothetical protein